MREELDDLDGPHLVGVSNAVVVDAPSNPADVGLLGPQGVMADSKRDPDAIEQLGRTPGSRLTHGFSPGPGHPET
jgi:hypothetical protein